MSEVILLTITDGTNIFQVDRKQAIELELKLNTSIYGRAWITIGDHLFNFGTNRDCDLKLVVDVFLYAFIYDFFQDNNDLKFLKDLLLF